MEKVIPELWGLVFALMACLCSYICVGCNSARPQPEKYFLPETRSTDDSVSPVRSPTEKEIVGKLSLPIQPQTHIATTISSPDTSSVTQNTNTNPSEHQNGSQIHLILIIIGVIFAIIAAVISLIRLIIELIKILVPDSKNELKTEIKELRKELYEQAAELSVINRKDNRTSENQNGLRTTSENDRFAILPDKYTLPLPFSDGRN